MKKQYQKPLLYAESFSLSEHIATCFPEKWDDGASANYQNSTSCHYVINNGLLAIFTATTVSTCDAETYEPDEDGNTFLSALGCYTTYNNTNNVFAS